MNKTISHPGCKIISREEWIDTLLGKTRTIPEIMDYFANQYYIYGEDRSHFEAAWTNDLRFAIASDYLHFTRSYFDKTNINFRGLHKKPRKGKYFFTKEILTQVFDHIEEITAYVVEEREMMDTICKMVHGAYELKEKTNFKNALAGKRQVTNW